MTERLLLALSEGLRSSQVALMVKNQPAHAGDANDVGSIPGAGNGNHSSILAWKIPWTRGAWQATVHGVAKSRT